MTFPGVLRSGVLSETGALEALDRLPASRLLLVSDTHGHYASFEAIILEFGPSCDALLFSGDGMWDLIQYLENAALSVVLRKALPGVLCFVAGNGDGDQFRLAQSASRVSIQESQGESVLIAPHRFILGASGHRILLVHGHRYSVDVSLDILSANARAVGADIGVFGHTHVAYTGKSEGVLMVNPGSPSRPRGGTLPGFALLELSSAPSSAVVRPYTFENEGSRRFQAAPVFQA